MLQMDIEWNDLAALSERVEELRKKLHEALDAAGGNQQDPAVLAASEEFDEAMNALMRLQSRIAENKQPPQEE